MKHWTDKQFHEGKVRTSQWWVGKQVAGVLSPLSCRRNRRKERQREEGF